MDTLEGTRRGTPSHDSSDREYQSFLSTLSAGEKMALAVTKKVGTVGFFLCVITWTALWCGYNILSTEIPSLHWRPFDPFPAFVAWLLISNVIQLCLMPLILIGQNLDAKQAESQAKRDFEVNRKAEKEIRITEAEISHIVDVVEALARCSSCEIPPRVRHLRHEDDPPVRMAED